MSAFDRIEFDRLYREVAEKKTAYHSTVTLFRQKLATQSEVVKATAAYRKAQVAYDAYADEHL